MRLMSKKIFLVSTVTFLLGGSAISQITVNNAQTPAQLVQNILLGAGVTATNISVNGSPLNSSNVQGNVTLFDAAGTTFPIASGVLLTTGNGVAAVGPNNAGGLSNNTPATADVSVDPHLNQIANGAVQNGVVLEFDFVPAGDTISFNYLFGSEEYPEFAPPQSSSFNDAFGFFLWGPGISGPYALGGYPSGGSNIAVVPGTTTPVTINNVNPITNQTYYQDNQGGAAYGTAIQYDGTTTLLSANASVQCGQTYHIKLAICNILDQGWDSGVFLQANSFSSEIVQVAVATVSGDTAVYEGCTFADFIFSRSDSLDSLTITYDITGTATDGIDFTSLGTSITFLPGQDTIVLTLDPIADGLIEPGGEFVTITAYTVNACGDTIASTGTVWIFDEPNVSIAEDDPTLLCGDDSLLVNAIASGGFAPYTYTWVGSSSTTSQAYVNASIQGPVEYYVTATDGCGYSVTDTVTVTLNQTLAIDTLISYPSSACVPTGAVSAFTSGMTGTPFYEWTGPGAGSPNSIDATVWQNLSPGWYYFSVTDNVCELNDSILVDVELPPIADFTASPEIGCSPLNVSFVNNSQNATNFEWNFGGTIVNVAGLAPQAQTFTNSAIVQLVAFDAGGCSDTTFTTIQVTPCGCTDPNAENYNSSAVFDDGSCFYPEPIIHVPNVFTPNNDSQNDIFFIDVQNASDLQFTIFNRWGNVIYEAQGLNSAWNGYIEGGDFAADGTYFVKYVVTGINGGLHEGHGFVQMISSKQP